MSKPKTPATKAQSKRSSNKLTEKYARQLQVIQKISQLTVSEEESEKVLQAVLQQLLDTLYYSAAQIYRISPSGKDLWLYLELGSGSKPVTQNIDIFSIYEDNIVSHAIRNKKPVYVPDIRTGPYSYYGQSEKDTEIRSEVSVPLESGQTVLGVLRVQSCTPDDFGTADLSFLETLSSLLAGHIKNARKLQQLQDNLQEVTILYNLQRKEDLDKHLRPTRQGREPGYQYDKSSRRVIESDQISSGAKLALAKEQLSPNTIQNEEQKELIVPIKLYGETIGVIGVEDSPAKEEWSPDDISLLEEVSSQVALAIENSRLLQQTQEQTKELSLLFDTSRQLSETIELHQIYEIVASQLINYLDSDICVVSLLNNARTHFKDVVVKTSKQKQDIPKPATGKVEAIEESAALQQMLKEPGLLVQYGDESDPALLEADSLLRGQDGGNSRPHPDNGDGNRAHTLAIFPLLVRKNLVGIAKVGHLHQRRDYTQNELQLAQAIISQVTVAIENTQLFEQTQDALAETQKLYEISRSLVETTDLEEIFKVVLENVRAYDIDRVSISLLDRDQAGEIEKVTIVANWDKNSEQLLPVGTKISADRFPLVQAFAQPPFYPMICEDLSRPDVQDERMDEAFRKMMYEELKAVTLFSVPMFLGPEYKGVISISTRSPHTYSDEEIRIYQTLADQAIIAIERHQLLEATRQERDRAALLYELGQTLSKTTSIDEVQKAVLSFTERLGAAHGEIFITDGEDFFSMASTIPERQAFSPEETNAFIKAVLSKGTEAYALKQQETILKNRHLEDIWLLDDEAGDDEAWMQSIISTPFHSRHSNLQGVLTFFSTTEDQFTEDHIAMFESMAIQTSATLENVWLLQQTASALWDTQLLYKATQDFNRAQHFEDLLAVLVESFTSSKTERDTFEAAQIDITHMSIALITALEENGAPKRLNIVADWDATSALHDGAKIEEQIVVAHPDIRTTSADYPFLKQIRLGQPYEIKRTPPGSEGEWEGAEAYMNEHMGKARSAYSIPLVIGSNWLGILFIGSRTERFKLKSNTLNQISALADQMAVVIQNLQLVEETQQNLYNSEILSHLSQELLSAETAEAIYKLSLDAVAATEPSRGAAIFMYDQMEGGVELELTAIWDNPTQAWPAVLPGARFSTEDLGLGPLLKTGQTVVSANASEDTRFSETLRQLLSLMQIKGLAAVPIWLNREVNGFILVGHKEGIGFAPDNVRLYENVGRLASGALENLRLFDQAQYRATQLQTAAEVSQAATSYLDLDTLLSQSVELIGDRFGFYHVSIFLVDEYQKYAVIEASTGQVGQQMLAMRHKLPVGGKSIVGTATATGQPKIALDVGKDAVHFNNPLLPNTRSEMALPLIARGQVIGALDVQSTKAGAFSRSDITILQSMANQLANAIEAARSFQEAKKALDEVNKIHEHYLRSEWSTFVKEQRAITGYRLTEAGLVPNREIGPEMDYHPSILSQAIETKHPIIVSGPFSTPDANKEIETPAQDGQEVGKKPITDSVEKESEPDSNAFVVAPLSLHGQMPIGAVDFEISNQEELEEDTLRIIEAVTTQAAQAIEAARLFEQTQAAREEAEALYRVGRALVAIERQQEMYDTVLKELLSTLGFKQGGILFFEQDKKFGKLHALFKENKPAQSGLRIPIEGNPSYEELIKTKSPVIITDFSTDPRVAPVRQLELSHNISSLLLVPIIIDDEVVGALGADSVEQIHHFTEREVNLAIAMADQLAIMLQNRRLLEETRRRAIQLQTSSDVGRVATSILDQDTMLDQAVELIKDRFGFYHVQILLTDDPDHYIVLNKSTGEAGQKLLNSGYRVRIGDRNVIGQAAHQRRAIVVRETDPDDSSLMHQRTELLPEASAELAIPLQVGDTLIGVLDVHSTSPEDFGKEDIATLETLGAQLAIAINNARAFREEQETAERLKEIDRLKTQFLANMSHELRTPLNSIIGFSRVILKGIDGPLTELQKTDLTSIYNSGQHLLGLINNVLDLSKIEAGKMELNFDQIEIGPIIKGVMSTALALVKDKEVELVQEIPEDLPTVWADATRIRQVILNLVSNACKFTDEGTVTLRARAEAEKIIISVSDTGVGIPVDQLDTIFEEFTQVDASTTRKVGGSGLGLPISRHFIEMHKGQIWVDSAPEKGSTFSFALPIKPIEDKLAEEDDISATNGKDGQGKTIVAIDDDPGVINLYKRFLEKRNYKIINIENTEDIVAQVKAYAPFAILLDILMPDKDGWMIMKDLKHEPFTKDIPVIICSIINDRNKGFSLGAADYLTKPIVESELVNALHNLRNQQQELVKVLVIDDQADDILLIRRMLEAHNYTIIEASNGKNGVDLARNRRPNLIILDLSMPDMDGFAVVEALKKDEETKNIPIIIVSAKELTQTEHEFLTDQVEVFLRKGIFTEDELLNDVSQALERFDTHAEYW